MTMASEVFYSFFVVIVLILFLCQFFFGVRARRVLIIIKIYSFVPYSSTGSLFKIYILITEDDILWSCVMPKLGIRKFKQVKVW